MINKFRKIIRADKYKQHDNTNVVVEEFTNSEGEEMVNITTSTYNLQDFKLSLTDEEQKLFLLETSNEYISRSDLFNIGESMAYDSTGRDDKRKLAIKILEYSLLLDDNEVDTHFTYLSLIKNHYYFREESEHLEKCIYYCEKDINLFTNFLYKFFSDPNNRITFGKMPNVPSFKQLAIIYENNKNYEKAITICNLAIKYNLDDGTKGGFDGRKSKIQKKKEKLLN